MGIKHILNITTDRYFTGWLDIGYQDASGKDVLDYMSETSNGDGVVGDVITDLKCAKLPGWQAWFYRNITTWHKAVMLWSMIGLGLIYVVYRKIKYSKSKKDKKKQIKAVIEA